MKNFKRILCVLLVLTMVIPMGMFSANAANALYSGANWNGFACKFSTSTNNIIAPKSGGVPVIKTAGYTMTDTANGGVKVTTPTYSEFNGVYAASALTSTNKTQLDGLTVVVQPDEFSNDVDTIGASNTISVLWTEDPITTMYNFDTDVGLSNSIDASSNGLRHLIPVVPGAQEGLRATASSVKTAGQYTGKALCVNVSNEYDKYTDTHYASTVSIVYYDGYYINTNDHHPGYRWTFRARNNKEQTDDADSSGIISKFEQIDLTYGLTVSVRADDTVGYIVNINGKDYYKGEDVAYFPDAEYKTKKIEGQTVADPECYGLGNSLDRMLTQEDYEQKTDRYKKSLEYQKLDINLNGLKEVTTGGYVTVGAVSNNDKNNSDHRCNYTVEKINAINANEWTGQAMDPSHEHVMTVRQVAEPTCTENGAIVRRCDCGKVETEVINALEHSYVIDYSKTYDATCTAKGHEYAVCSKCGDIKDNDIEALNHSYDDWYIKQVATESVEGVKEHKCIRCGYAETESYNYSSTDDFADDWEISAENQYSAIYQGNLVGATKNSDNSLTISDTSRMLDNNSSFAAITKAVNKNKVSLDYFTTTIKPEALNTTETSVYPKTVSLLFTTDYNKYNVAGEYSTGSKSVDFPSVAYENKLRYGHLWNPTYETGEYSLSLVLMDSVTIDASHVTYGTPDDGYYDVVYWANIANGNFWKDSYQVLDTPVKMGDDIFFEMYYETDDPANKASIFIGINSEEEMNFFALTGQDGSQLTTPSYYVAYGAFSPMARDDSNGSKSASSFTIKDICGENPDEFDGWTFCSNVEYYGVHNLNAVEAKAATCEEGGTIAYYKCAECGAMFTDATGTTPVTDISDGTNPTGHSKTYTDWTADKKATCTKPGTEVQKCTQCDAVMNTRATKALGHDESGKWKTKATSTSCIYPGYKELKCKTCDERINTQVYYAAHTELEHTERKEATYSAAGNIEYWYCKDCGKYYSDAEATKEITKADTVIAKKTLKFTDVPEGWYYESVGYCVDAGLFSGMSETIFAPMNKLTREQFMQVLFNFAGQKKEDWQGPTGFDDVAEGKWYSPAIKWAGETGITSGLGPGRFGLTVQITREQFAVLLMNYAGQIGKDTSKRADISAYTDKGDISSWAVDGIRWAVAEELMSGTSATNLSPKTVANRATATRLFMNFDIFCKKDAD